MNRLKAQNRLDLENLYKKNSILHFRFLLLRIPQILENQLSINWSNLKIILYYRIKHYTAIPINFYILDLFVVSLENIFRHLSYSIIAKIRDHEGFVDRFRQDFFLNVFHSL